MTTPTVSVVATALWVRCIIVVIQQYAFFLDSTLLQTNEFDIIFAMDWRLRY